MKITFDWLKDHLNTNLKEEKLLDQLTNIGLEVENVENLSSGNELFKIAKIIKTEKHPNADRLKICDVNIGEKELKKVVCGATNAREGLLTIYAPPGATIPKTKINVKSDNIFIETSPKGINQNPPINEMGIPSETQKANFGLRNNAKIKTTSNNPYCAFLTNKSIRPLKIFASLFQVVNLISLGSILFFSSTYFSTASAIANALWLPILYTLINLEGIPLNSNFKSEDLNPSLISAISLSFKYAPF